jgi:hypothetical protein
MKNFEALGRKLSKNEMKNLIGGKAEPTYGSCGATATCKNGTTVSIQCQGFGISCTGVDYGTTYPGTSAPPADQGYVYCTNSDGGYSGRSC